MRNTALDLEFHDMTEYLDHVMGQGDFGDEDESDGQGSGMARFGRRIFYWDDQGFQDSELFDTVEAATAWFSRLSTDNYHSTCEKCGTLVHNDEASWYEHTKYECGEDVNDDNRYSVASMPGVAFYVVKRYPLKNQVVAVMVGDDKHHILDDDQLTVLGELDYCVECGQIGCTADARDRDS